MNAKDIAEIDESLEEQTQLPEAPMSINIRAYYKGFSVMFTKRSDEKAITPQIDGITAVVTKLIEKGYMPSWNTETNARANGTTTASTTPPIAPHPQVEAPVRACPTCGGSTKFKQGFRGNRPWKGYFCLVDESHSPTWVR